MPDGIRFLFDENMGKRVVDYFLASGYDIVSVADVSPGARDTDVLKRAVDEGRILVTRDKDFAELVFHSGLPHTGIILLRLQHQSPKHTIPVLETIFAQLNDIPDVHKKFILVSEDKVRVR